MQVGNVDVHPIADGTFRASPQYFGDQVTIHGHEDLFSRHGKAWLHSDHCGWLFDVDARPVFQKAGLWFGAPDWQRFVVNREAFMLDHIRHGLASSSDDRLHPVTQDTAVAAGVDLLMTPGHTPGHLAVVVSSQGKRALLLGDAITCPVQLDEPSWQRPG